MKNVNNFNSVTVDFFSQEFLGIPQELGYGAAYCGTFSQIYISFIHCLFDDFWPTFEKADHIKLRTYYAEVKDHSCPFS